MADSKKYNGSTWEHSLRKLGTATDTTTSLPADLYADGTNATVGLKGNMSQSGTPTPQNPITPSECGERMGNLFDYQTMAISEENSYLKPDGSIGASNDWNVTDFIPCDGTEFTLSYVGGKTPAFCLYDGNKQYITGKSYNTGGAGIKWTITITSQTVAKYIRFSYCNLNTPYRDTLSSIMLNTGSTALPYEPYGYKLDIKSASTTTPVYLGEVQTTRKIKKLVLTGEEGWERTQTQRYYINASTGCPTDYLKQTITTSICSHYQSQNNTASGSNAVKAGHFCFYTGGGFELYIGETTISSAADFKSYLAQQYAAGTPVTVWYVLASETTGIVNEPLRKIGSYADTVSGISIPTITGKDTFDVLTTLKPSEVELTYTGWHDASVGEWDGSDWQ